MTSLGLTDAPVMNIKDESLGMMDYVDALSTFISTCDTPMTIAFQGDWGCGKTSMMNMVRENLAAGETKIMPLWFNTWQFAQFKMQDDIALSLLSSFLDELGDAGKDLRRTLLGGLRSLGRKFGSVAETVAEISGLPGGKLLKEGLEKFTQPEQDNAVLLRDLRKNIEKTVAELLKKSNADRMAIFIDDLDRLVPERAVEILETIKLFLDIPQCVFVLAVDYHVVSKGLEKKFGVGSDDLKGKSFFDKIIQLPFNMPVAQYDICKYMPTLFRGAVTFRPEDLKTLVQLAENSIGSNPRSLKRLFNALQLLNIVASRKSIMDSDAVATSEERQRLLFAVLCLQLAYEPVYRLLLMDSTDMSADYIDNLLKAIGQREQSDTLSSENKNLLIVVKKSLPPAAEEGEAFIRFAVFMRAFKNAVQLDSDTSEGGGETINEYELDLLRQFLSLSSITSTVGASATSAPGTFRYKAAFLAYLEQTLKLKYQATLAKLGSTFESRFRENEFEIGFWFRLGPVRFGLFMTWRDWVGLNVSVWKADGGDYKLIRDWLRTQLKDTLPEPPTKYPSLNSDEYIIFSSQKLEANRTPESEMALIKPFQQQMENVLDIILPLLVTFYEVKRPLVNQLLAYTNKIHQRLTATFPAEDGWLIENRLGSMAREVDLLIQLPSWEGKLALSLAATQAMMGGLYLGLHRRAWQRKYSNEDSIYASCEQSLFPEGANNTGNCKGNLYVFAHYLPQPFSSARTGGDCLDPKVQFAYPTEEQENQAVEAIVERLSRFKKILPELDALAASAQ